MSYCIFDSWTRNGAPKKPHQNCVANFGGSDFRSSERFFGMSVSDVSHVPLAILKGDPVDPW